MEQAGEMPLFGGTLMVGVTSNAMQEPFQQVQKNAGKRKNSDYINPLKTND